MSTYEANRYNFNGENLSIPASAIPNLDTAKITTGTFADARLAASNVTQHVTPTTSIEGDWTPSCSNGAMNIDEGRYYKIGKLVMCVASGSFSTRTDANFTRWRVTNLPFTASDTAGNTYATVRTAGSGFMNLRGETRAHDLQTVVRPNTTEVRFFSASGAALTATATSAAGGGNENVSIVSENKMIANLNLRAASNVGYYFYLFFIYRSKT